MNIVITNIIPVLVSALIPLVVGTIWYSKAVFGKIWMKYHGGDEKVDGMGKKIIISYITYFFIAYALSILINYLVIASIIPSIILALVIWLGFVVPTVASEYIWSSGKPVTLFIIQTGSFLISLVLMSITLAYWI